MGLPILMRLHRKQGVSLIDLAETRLQQLAGWLPERSFRVHADGFYATLAGRGLVRLQLVSRMRRDAVLFEPLTTRRRQGRPGRPRTKGRRLLTPEQMARRRRSWKSVPTTERGQVRKRLVYAKPVVWYRVSQTPALLVISRNPTGRERDDFFFSTDLSLPPAQVIGKFAGRWSIEDTFRNTKQFVGGEEPQTWKGPGPERAAMLSLWLSSGAWLWYLSQKDPACRVLVPRWYPQKAHASFQDALASLRRYLWGQRIISLFGKRFGHDKNLETLFATLAKAA